MSLRVDQRVCRGLLRSVKALSLHLYRLIWVLEVSSETLAPRYTYLQEEVAGEPGQSDFVRVVAPSGQLQATFLN